MICRTLTLATLLVTPLAAQEIVLVPGFRRDFRGLASQENQVWSSNTGPPGPAPTFRH